MKHILFTLFIGCIQITFAQYTFKYESVITQLNEIENEDCIYKANTNSEAFKAAITIPKNTYPIKVILLQ